jgi:glyceraldehyde 3-phosphate dehydrogenase
MAIRVAINGFGRIGRNFVRAVLESEAVAQNLPSGSQMDLEIVAINELAPAEASAHLLSYDSTHGRLSTPVTLTSEELQVGRHKLALYAERDPKSLPWQALGIDVVVESTGRFTTRADAMAHVEAGARRVVISAPSKDADATFVVGVNDGEFQPDEDVIVSNASCTTNCLVPMVKVLDEAFGIRQGLMTTVHAYTNDQELLDLGRDNLRRSRAAAVNVVPSSTGAARATSLVLAQMAGRLDGLSLRVPVVDGSITDLTAVVNGEVSVGQVNDAFRRASQSGRLSRVLEYNEAEIVSSDIIGSPASCTFDATLTMSMSLGSDMTLVKVMGWYDNEWGYAHRLVDLVGIIGRA